MTAPFALGWCSAILPAFACLLAGPVAFAQTPPADSGSGRTAEPTNVPLPAYHHSLLSWEHSVTAATLGVGNTPQSANPTYTMGLSAKTRYYLLEDTARGEHWSLRLDAGLYREFTNSDTTTARGEWAVSDTDLASVYARRFRGQTDADGTFAEVRPLTLTLPTSKASFDAGRYVAPGVLVGLTHVTPVLRGRVEPEIGASLRFAVGYKRWFARAAVPTNPSLERVRLTPDGRSLPGDALSGSALVRDQLDLSARLRLAFGLNVFWTTDVALAPAWKYNLKEAVPLCGVVLTGCVDVTTDPTGSRYLLRTQFNTEVALRVGKGLSVELGYGNSSNQLAPDGRRRNLLYSPDAVFYASLSFYPHELVSGAKRRVASQSVASKL